MRSSVRAECSREPGRLLLGGRAGHHVDGAGESIPELPDDRDVVVPRGARLLRHGGRGEHRLDRFTGQRSGWSQLRGVANTPTRIRTGDPQRVGEHIRQIGATELPRKMLGHKLIDDRMDRGRNSSHERLDTAQDGEAVAPRKRLRIEFRQRVDGMSQRRQDLTCVDVHYRTHVRIVGRHSDK